MGSPSLRAVGHGYYRRLRQAGLHPKAVRLLAHHPRSHTNSAAQVGGWAPHQQFTGELPGFELTPLTPDDWRSRWWSISVTGVVR